MVIHSACGPEPARKTGRTPIISEVTKVEHEEYRVKKVAQGQQGRWTTWECCESGNQLAHTRLRFLIRATYDTLSSPCNLHQWLGAEQPSDLCATISASLYTGRLQDPVASLVGGVVDFLLVVQPQ